MKNLKTLGLILAITMTALGGWVVLKTPINQKDSSEQKRQSVLNRIDSATAMFGSNEVGILEEAKGGAICHLYKERQKNVNALSEIRRLDPPPTTEEEKRYLFSVSGIKERGRRIESDLSRRTYEAIKKRQPLGVCNSSPYDDQSLELDEIEFFEKLVAELIETELDDTPAVAAQRVRAAFKDLLRRKVRDVRERARLEYIAGKVGEAATFRQKLSDLEEKGAEWKFTMEELGIEPHLLNHPETKPLG